MRRHPTLLPAPVFKGLWRAAWYGLKRRGLKMRALTVRALTMRALTMRRSGFFTKWLFHDVAFSPCAFFTLCLFHHVLLLD